MTQALTETIYGHLKLDEALSLINALSDSVARSLRDGGSMVPVSIEQTWLAGQAVIVMRVGLKAETYVITDTEMPL